MVNFAEIQASRINGARATGWTTDQLRDCLHEFVKGKTIIYIYAYAFAPTMNILALELDDAGIKWGYNVKTKTVMHRDSDGLIKFIPNDPSLIINHALQAYNRNTTEVVVDHGARLDINSKTYIKARFGEYKDGHQLEENRVRSNRVNLYEPSRNDDNSGSVPEAGDGSFNASGGDTGTD